MPMPSLKYYNSSCAACACSNRPGTACMRFQTRKSNALRTIRKGFMPLSRLRFKTTLMALAMFAIFSFGLTKLFLLRFEAGDVYPPYSSLRSDPLGTRVLFESLNQMEAGTARRHFRPLDKIDFDPDKTVLLCGLPEESASHMRGLDWERMLSSLAQNGGRLVLSFSATAQRRKPQADTAADAQTAPVDEDKNAPPAPDPQTSGPEELHPEQDQWQGLDALGIKIARAVGKSTGAAQRVAAENPARLLPAELPWRGALYFDALQDGWQTLYTLDGKAVLVERHWGNGTLVMMADSYLLSNEAMRKERFVDLLAWLLKPPNGVLVDESHLGLTQQSGIAGLALKYRLQGVIAVVILLTVLLIWQQTAIFAPRPRDPKASDGRENPTGIDGDTADGLTHLMRQHIAEAQLLQICYERWIDSAAAATLPEEKKAHVKALITAYQQAPRAQDPVAIYRHICQSLKQGKIL